MLTPEEKEKVKIVLSHPAFQFQDSKGKEFYTQDKLEELFDALDRMIAQMDEKYPDLPVPERVQEILCHGTSDFPCNYDQVYASDYDSEATIFPDERLQGRTAYGLLCTNAGATCTGFCEASCLLLTLKGYQAAPLLCKLLKPTQRVCHYVAGVIDQDGQVQVIDAERLRSCMEPEKDWSLLAYQCSLRYTISNEFFAKEKIGKTGLGPKFFDYIDRPESICISPIERIQKEYPEYVDENGKLDLRNQMMTEPKQKALRMTLTTDVKDLVLQSYQQYFGGSLEKDRRSIL